jgi:hypothetical protein
MLVSNKYFYIKIKVNVVLWRRCRCLTLFTKSEGVHTLRRPCHCLTLFTKLEGVHTLRLCPHHPNFDASRDASRDVPLSVIAR